MLNSTIKCKWNLRKTFFLLFLFLSQIAKAQYSFIDLDQNQENKYQKIIKENNIIVIGEIHGAKEIPLVVLEIAKEAHVSVENLSVALEISSDFQEDINNFLIHGQVESLNSIEHFQFPDGRSSLAMVELIKGIRELKGVNIICFDAGWKNNRKEKRDSIMAVNLKNAYHGQTMIILTGNLHAVLDLESMRSGYKSAIYHFIELMGLTDEIISLNTYFGGGSVWNCQKEGCGVFSAGKVKVLETNGLKNFIRYDKSSIINGFNGFLFFEEVTASEPFGFELKQLFDLIKKFKSSISQKDSLVFKELFFDDEVPFIGVMSKSSEGFIQEDIPEFHGISISNNRKFIKEICQSQKSHKEEIFNKIVKTDGIIASISFDYAYFFEEDLFQWGNEKWNLVKMENKWLITNVVYSINLPEVLQPTFLK